MGLAVLNNFSYKTVGICCTLFLVQPYYRPVHSSIFCSFFVHFSIPFFQKNEDKNESRNEAKNTIFWKMASWAVFLNPLIFHAIFRLHFLRSFQSPISWSIVSNHGIHRYLTIFLSSHHHAHPICCPSTPFSSTSIQLTTHHRNSRESAWPWTGNGEEETNKDNVVCG